MSSLSLPPSLSLPLTLLSTVMVRGFRHLGGVCLSFSARRCFSPPPTRAAARAPVVCTAARKCGGERERERHGYGASTYLHFALSYVKISLARTSPQPSELPDTRTDGSIRPALPSLYCLHEENFRYPSQPEIAFFAIFTINAVFFITTKIKTSTHAIITVFKYKVSFSTKGNYKEKKSFLQHYCFCGN